MNDAPPARIFLGRIIGVHGLRGEVVVRSETADPMDIGIYGELSDAAGKRQLSLKAIRLTPKGGVIARVAGVNDRNAAEALAGTDLYIERSHLPPPKDDEFYHVDLIGLKAETSDGALIGTVVSVHNFGAGDLLELQLSGAAVTEFIPLTEAWVPEIDIPGGRIVIIPPDISESEDGDDPDA